MLSILHIIIYITSILSAENVNIGYGNGKERFKFIFDLEPVYNENNVIFKMESYYFPCFAFLYSENKEIAEFSTGFYDDDFEDWCISNLFNDYEHDLWVYFSKLFSGEIRFKTEKQFFTNKKQLELIVGVIKPENYKTILTKFIQENADLDRNATIDFSARAALNEKMVKELESKIIYYGLRFSDTSDDNLPNLEDYRLFSYERKKDSTPLENNSQNTTYINEFNDRFDSHIQMPYDYRNYKMDGVRNYDIETYNDLLYNKSNAWKSDRDYEFKSYNNRFDNNRYDNDRFDNNRRFDGKKRPGKKNNDEPSPTTKKSTFSNIMAVLLIVGVFGVVAFIVYRFISK
jgi:hypothetical protein